MPTWETNSSQDTTFHIELPIPGKSDVEFTFINLGDCRADV